MVGIERNATVDAAPDVVWSVLADFGAISAWVPMIQHSCLLSEQSEGVGTVRRVQIDRQTLVERVVTWDPPGRLAYDIQGLPPIVGTVRNSWTLSPSGDGTGVVLATEIHAGRNPAKALIAKQVLARMASASELMLAGLARLATAVIPLTEPSTSSKEAS